MPTPKEDFIISHRLTIILILLALFITSWIWLFYNLNVQKHDKSKEIQILAEQIRSLESKVNTLSVNSEVAGVSTDQTTDTISQTSSGKININIASQEELETLPNIGPAKASDIINYREENGEFNSIDEITNVKGIGDATLEKLRDLITTD